MKHGNRLKSVRVAVAVLFLAFTMMIFLDFTGIVSAILSKPAVFLQFAPSLIKFIRLAGFGSAGFLVVIVLTVLFGRVYCSTVCPAGTVQDVFIYLKRKLSRRYRFRFMKAHHEVNMTILLAVTITMLAGSTLLVNLLDPYSNFGRMTAHLVRPVVIGINNLVVAVVGTGQSLFLKPVDLKTISLLPFFFSLIFTGVLLFFSLTRGRQYCNLICPVGILLGYLSRIALFRIRLDKTLCNSCGACLTVCKAGCIDIRNREVAFSRCIGCFNCLNVCPSDGVRYRMTWGTTAVEKRETGAESDVDLSKRKFLAVSGALLAGLMALAVRWKSPGHQASDTTAVMKSGITDGSPVPVTPPGSLGYDHFTTACTACHLCVTACPTQVLQPALLDYGLLGIMQPKMDYMTNYCNYECTVCTTICPTGAILPLTSEEKKLTQLGKSRFIKEECIVYTKKTACGACSERCPTKAVNMVPYENALTIPEVNNEICIGCGACQYACPTDPKAIVVDANRVHQVAKPPKEGKEVKKIDYKEEFPF
jgi:polyferredoxin